MKTLKDEIPNLNQIEGSLKDSDLLDPADMSPKSSNTRPVPNKSLTLTTSSYKPTSSILGLLAIVSVFAGVGVGLGVGLSGTGALLAAIIGGAVFIVSFAVSVGIDVFYRRSSDAKNAMKLQNKAMEISCSRYT